MRKYTRVYAEIDLDCIVHNMEAMKANLNPGTRMMGVVKTDGYGHGAVPVAQAIEPFTVGYAVAALEEGIILRNHGIKKPILILGVTHPSRYEEMIRFEICPSIFQYEKAVLLSKAAGKAGKKAGFHLALDTGMSRIGMKPDETSADMVKEMGQLPDIEIQGMFTHFAKADETDKEASAVQYDQYLHFVKLLEERGIRIPVCHCGNSAGIIDLPEMGLDMVRAGISIYGLYPSDEVDRQRVELWPAMSLKSFITYIKTIEPGAAVSYGGTFVAEKTMRIATVPVGYGDGYPRNLSNRGHVLIHGKPARILGRVCMDQFMVDVTGIPEAAEDDPVTLIGPDGAGRITVEDLAEAGGGFHYEIICDIGKRVPRVYKKGGETVGTKDYFDDIYRDFSPEKC